MSKLKVAVIGAGGKMGVRTSTNLTKISNYDLYLVENSDKGLQSIKNRGFTPYKTEDIVPKVEVVVLAVPDTLINVVSKDIVKLMSPGAGLLILDPAAAVAKELALRDDCTFGVVHPCHPSYSFGSGRDQSRWR